MPRMIPYFSYGHNSNAAELYKRIPDARLMGAADLYGYRFKLDHYANVVREPGAVVHGVLWMLPVSELGELDWDEDYGYHYRHRIVEVDFQGRMVRAMMYVMVRSYHDPRPPSREYVRWIAQGYRDNRIPLSQLKDALRARLDQR